MNEGRMAYLFEKTKLENEKLKADKTKLLTALKALVNKLSEKDVLGKLDKEPYLVCAWIDIKSTKELIKRMED